MALDTLTPLEAHRFAMLVSAAAAVADNLPEELRGTFTQFLDAVTWGAERAANALGTTADELLADARAGREYGAALRQLPRAEMMTQIKNAVGECMTQLPLE